jgi:signal peptidase II
MRRPLVLLAGAIFLLTAGCDAGTKALAVARLHPEAPTVVVPGWVELTLAYNDGVAFSFLRALPPGLIAGGAVALLAAVCFAMRGIAASRAGAAALGLIAAGGVCNAVDRFADGFVTDMIHVAYWPGIFNVADVAIVAGAGLAFVALSRPTTTATPPPRP